MFETVFKAIGEPTRLKILRLLAAQDLCVCDLEEVLQISQPRVSQHLKVLKQAGLVSERREAQKRICSFDRGQFTKIIEAFNDFMDKPLDELEGFEQINIRLSNLDGKSCERKQCTDISDIIL
ncbi:MAG: metalloregulator ArsR/SmtB family transcription factor [Bacillota bacterium]|nr:metalloregulator ArsR/SmtB family transcription factor [Bacillota bacterium]